MILYKQESNGQLCFIQSVKSEAEALEIVSSEAKKMSFENYLRFWRKDGYVKYDFGSHNEFFILQVEDWKDD